MANIALLAVLVGLSAFLADVDQWRPLYVFALLASLAAVSQIVSRRFEVGGAINITGSDIYLFAAMALLGPIPALVIAVSVEFGVTVLLKPRRSAVKVSNNVLANAAYALAGGLPLWALQQYAGLAPGDPLFLAAIPPLMLFANVVCFVFLAGSWTLAFRDPFRSELATIPRFAPAQAIGGVLTVVGVSVYVSAGFGPFAALMVAFLASELLLGRLTTVEVALRRERDRAQRYLDIAGAIIVVVDADGHIELVNKRGCEVLGRPEGQLLGASWRELIANAEDTAPFERLLAGRAESARFEARVATGSGEERLVAWEARALRHEASVTCVLASGEDITDRRRAEEEVAFLAFHDRLTRLANRAKLDAYLARNLERARAQGQPVALLFLDLDNFKLVNDNLGHAAGDQVLIQVAERLRSITRDTDLVVRYGGDEFLIFLSRLEGESPIHAAHEVAHRVEEMLREPYYVGGAELRNGASVGVALFPYDADDAEALLKRADEAMYGSKLKSRADFEVRRVAVA